MNRDELTDRTDIINPATDEGRWVPEWELTAYYDQAIVDGTNIAEWRADRVAWAAEEHPGVEGGIWEDSIGIHWRPTTGGDWS